MRDQVFAKVTGIGEWKAKIKNFRTAAEAAFEQAVPEAAQIILEQSNELCPVDTGALRASGQVTVTGKGFKTVAIVGYTEDYAIYVHENLEAYHEPPTQAKFLEEAVRRYKGDAQDYIRQRVMAAIKAAKFWRGVKTSVSGLIQSINKSISSPFAKGKSTNKALKILGKSLSKQTRVSPKGLLGAAKFVLRTGVKITKAMRG